MNSFACGSEFFFICDSVSNATSAEQDRFDRSLNHPPPCATRSMQELSIERDFSCAHSKRTVF